MNAGRATSRLTGFTLLELLVGLSLVGLILVLLFAGLRLGDRSWEAGETRLTASSNLAVAARFIRHELEQIQPYHWKNTTEEQTLAFAGSADAIHFVGPVPSRVGVSGLHLVGIEAVSAGDGKALAMRWHLPDPEVPDFSLLEGAEPKNLVEDVEELSFAYFGAPDDTTDPAWHDSWDFPNRLPQLIRLRLTLKSGEIWPEIVVAPRINGEGVGCVWDSFHKRCLGGK